MLHRDEREHYQEPERGDVCVLNYEDPVLREFGETLKDIKVVYFSSLRTLKQGFYLKEDEIVYNTARKRP